MAFPTHLLLCSPFVCHVPILEMNNVLSSLIIIANLDLELRENSSFSTKKKKIEKNLNKKTIETKSFM